ncbi:MAG TPA: hypothetical protein DIT94_10050 [Deltaproteobacteria bacterium]|nr:hypothetical protein [Deltaproteobacteria bacterium]
MRKLLTRFNEAVHGERKIILMSLRNSLKRYCLKNTSQFLDQNLEQDFCVLRQRHQISTVGGFVQLSLEYGI